MTTRPDTTRDHGFAAGPGWLRTPLVLLVALLLVLTAVPGQASADEHEVSFTDGGVVVDGDRYARQGDTVTLTVEAPPDTKCILVSGAHEAERSGGQLASTEVFAFQVGGGDGASVVDVETFGNAGCNNNGVLVGSASYERDNTAPTVTGELQDDNLGDHGWYRGEVTVAWTCTDEGSGVGPDACPEDSVHDLGEGENLTVASPQVEDRVGNEATASVTGVKVDSTSPKTTADAPDGWKSDDVTVVLEASDNLSGVAETFYRLDDEGAQEGAGWETYGGSLFYEDEGWYDLEYYSVDRAGNHEAVKSVEFGIDKTAPGITTSQDPSPNGAGWNNTDVTVSFECTDGASDIASCTSPVTVGQEVKDHQVLGTAVDNAGNDATAKRLVSIDKTAPQVNHTIGGTSGNGDWYTSPVTIAYTCDDPESNGVASGIASCPGSEEIKDDGANQSGEPVTVEDAAGNSARLTVAGIDIDQTAPTTTAHDVPADWVNEPVDVTLTATDGGPSGVAATYYRVDGGDRQTYEDGSLRFAEDGTYRLTYWSVDNAGNAEGAQHDTIRVDTVAPVSTVSLSTDDWTNQPVTVTLSAEDEEGGSGPHLIRYQLDDGAVQDYDDSFDVSSHGEQTLTYWAVDNAGNVEKERTTTIFIDTVAPSLTGEALETNLGNGDWYIGDITVEWTCGDVDSGIDGACPDDTVLTEEGSDLSASEHVDDNAGNRTDATVDGLKLDRSAPSTVAVIDVDANDAGWNSEDVTVDLTANDELSGVATTSYRVDGGTWQTTDHDEHEPVRVAFTEDGEYTLEYRSEDVAGNVETVDSIEVKVDQSAPTITSSQNPEANDAGWNNEPVTVSFDCTDNGPSGIASCTQPVDHPQEVENHEVRGTAVDNAGNSAHTQHTVSIDLTDPEVTSDVSGEQGTGSWFTGPVAVTFECSDPGSVASGIPAGTCPDEQVLTDDGSGQASTSVTVHDRAGNQSQAHQHTGIDIDQTAPVTTDNVTEGWTNDPVTVELDATDNLSGVATTEYRIGSDGDFEEYDDDAPVVFTEDGTHTLYYRSVDSAGNVESTNTATIKIDLVAPKTSASGLPDTDWTNESVTITLTATDTGGSDVDTTYYRIGDDGEQTYDDPVQFSDEGVYEVAYWSVDGAGNVENENQATVRIDKTAPTTTSNAPSDWQTQAVTVELTASDSGGSGVATTSYTFNGGSEQSYTEPFDLGEGVHDLAFWSVDGAGNVEDPSTATVRIDLSDPELEVTAPTNNSSTNATQVTVEGTVSDDVSGITTVTVDDTEASYDPDEGTFELADVALDCGPNMLTAEATNTAGLTTDVEVSVERRCATVTSVDRPLQSSSQGDVNVNDLRGNRVVPVTVELEYLDEAYTGSNATLGNPTVSLRALPDCRDVEGDEAPDAESAGNANTDDQFRANGDSWIYNLSSRDLETGVCYRVDVRLDGTRASNDLWTVVRAQ